MKMNKWILLATATLFVAASSSLAHEHETKELPTITKRRPAPPQKFDRNKDGKLDAAEKQAAREDIKARMNALRAPKADEFDRNQRYTGRQFRE